MRPYGVALLTESRGPAYRPKNGPEQLAKQFDKAIGAKDSLRDENPQVRIAAIKVLVKAAEAHPATCKTLAVTALGALLERERNNLVRKQATDALRKIQ